MPGSDATEPIITPAVCLSCRGKLEASYTISDNVPSLPPSYLHSSFSPAPLQSTQCTADIALLNTAIRECDNEMAALRKLLVLHQEKMTKLRKRVSHFRAVISPIRRMPKEILLKIFTHCTTTPYIGRFGTHGLLNTPSSIPIIRLGRVCSWWRRLILSAGTLWASFECELNESMSPEGIGLKCLEAHLERSKDALLSFLVKGEMVLPGHTTIRRLLDERRRWKHASFNCPEFSVAGWELEPGGFPHLTDIWVDSTCLVDADADADGVLPMLQIAAPSLRYLDLAPALARQVLFPMERISHLVLNHYSSTAELFRSLSTACASLELEYLELYQGRGDDDDDDFDYIDFHVNARARKILPVRAILLVISHESQGCILKLLINCFSFPQLHTLKIGRHERVSDTTVSRIVNLAAAFLETVDHLKSLTIHGLPLDDADVLRLTNRTPLLEELSLTFQGPHGPLLFKELTPSSRTVTKPPLPLLRGVNFCFDSSSSGIMQSLIDMLTTRLQFSSDMATLDNIMISFSRAEDVMEAAMYARTAAPGDYWFRWMGHLAFSLLKSGHKQRWTEVAEGHYVTLFNPSYFEEYPQAI